MSDNITLSVFFAGTLLVGGFLIQVVLLWIAFRKLQQSMQKDNETKINAKLGVERFNEFKEDQNQKFAKMDSDIKILVETNNDRHKELKSDFIAKVDDFRKYVELGFKGLEKLINSKS